MTEPRQASDAGSLFYGSVTISSKGQVVIPRRVRDEFGLRAGDQLIVLGRPEQDGFALVKPAGFLRVQEELARLQAQLGAAGVGVGVVVAAPSPASGDGQTGPD